MQVVEYSKSLEQDWDEFVFKSKNGTVLHTQKFLSYHPENRWVDKSVLIYNNGDLKAVFPACEVEGEIISHAGSSCGGLIVLRSNKLSETSKYFQLLINYYNKHDKIVFKKHERIFDVHPAEEIELAAIQVDFNVIYKELSTCVKLSGYTISKNRLDKVNRASKKIRIVENDSDYASFHIILENNLADKHAVRPTHSLSEMLKLKSLMPCTFSLLSAYYQDKMIAGIWLIKANDKVLHTFYVSQNYEFKNLYSISYLMNKVLEMAKRDGFEYVNFGVSTEDKGKIVNQGLVSFKESFGGFGVDRITYSKDLK